MVPFFKKRTISKLTIWLQRGIAGNVGFRRLCFARGFYRTNASRNDRQRKSPKVTGTLGDRGKLDGIKEHHDSANGQDDE